MIHAILYSFIAGVIGTMIGGAISLILGARLKFNTNIVLAIASGFMLAISCFELIPQSISSGGLVTCLIGLAIGVIALSLVDIFIGRRSRAPKSNLQNSLVVSKKDNARLGLIVFLAIALHNLPEGMAIGSKEIVGSSVAMTILITLHNIPEGMAMATPMLASGVKKYKIFLYVFLSGLPTVLGGVIGGLVGGINNYFNAGCMALAAGAMLYVVVFELYKECYKEEKQINYVAFANLIGIVLGMVAIVILE